MTDRERAAIKARFAAERQEEDAIIAQLWLYGCRCRVDVKEDIHKRWLFIVHGHCDDGRHYVVAARKALASFRELQAQICS